MKIKDCKGCTLMKEECLYSRDPHFIQFVDSQCPCSICLAKLNCYTFCSKRKCWSIEVALMFCKFSEEKKFSLLNGNYRL